MKPYQKGLDYGLVTGVAVKEPQVLANIVKEAKRTLLVIGSKSRDFKVGDKTQVDTLLEIQKKLDAPIVATGDIYKTLKEKGFPEEKITIMNIMNLTDRLKDPEWKGLDGEGPYDVVIFAGHLVFHLSQMLSTLLNFAYDRPMKTVCLDYYHQPNARFSLANLDDNADYTAFLEEFVSTL
ncbi:MAG: CO dehydrogenase/acetyl-CoA synthase complex subunit epsilon [Promethearchaeota archaeon]